MRSGAETFAAMIHLGTCGYSYADWKGPFYPPTIRSNAMLGFYARAFTAVEIDATYYHVPAEASFRAMADRVPAGFRFSVKYRAVERIRRRVHQGACMRTSSRCGAISSRSSMRAGSLRH